MSYLVKLNKKSEKSLARLHPDHRKIVRDYLLLLAEDPLHNSEALSGNLYGLRRTKAKMVRIVFYCYPEEKLVLIDAIGYRGNSY